MHWQPPHDQQAGLLVPAHLRCEYLVNPLAVGVARPRLSWIVQPARGNLRGLRQAAWQVLVASTSEKLAADEGDLWDSGRVDSDQCNQVAYAGRPLRSGQACFWKVRVWAPEGGVSAWSEPATWSMGLLEPADWQAKWIGAPVEVTQDRPGPSPMLRCEFRVDGPVRRAVAYASALGLYDLHLNGRRVGEQVLSPEWTDYSRRVQYQAYDVTALLQPGANAVGAMLGEGWYAGRLGICHVKPGGQIRHFYGPRPRLLLQIHIELEDGRTQTVVSDGAWRYTVDGPIRYADLFDGEMYDARREMPGWDRPAFVDAGWMPVDVVERIDAALVAQPNEPIRVGRQIRPVAVHEPEPGVYVFDLGQNTAGWCRLRLREPAGTVVRLRHAEMRKEDGGIYRENLRMPKDGGPLGARQEDRYVARGDGEEIYEPRFTYHGFQYVEVTGLTVRPTLDSLTGCAVYSAAPEVGGFECSSAMLNRLFSNILWTQRDNLPSVPTDCPQRDERMGWTGDMQVFCQTAMFNMDMAGFFTKWIQDLRDAQADDGRFPDFAPMPYDSNERMSGAPAWGDAGTVVPWKHYVNYADTHLLGEHFEAARRWVDWIRSHNPDLVWRHKRHNDYGDWLHGDTLRYEGWPRTGGEVPKEVFATAFFAYSTQLVSRMAAVIGMQDEASKYAKLAQEICAAFCREFVSPDGRICGDTQAGYALALHFDLLPEALRARAAAHMVEGLARYNGHMSTGFNSTIRMMLELTRWGYNDRAYELINHRDFPSWGYMIENGATTIWERWDGYVKGRGFQDPGMNSFCHYAIGAVGEWMYRVILGINPDERQPGYRHFVLRPMPGGGLTWAKGHFESIRGRIEVGWRRENGTLTLDVTVPANTAATLYVPTAEPAGVTEGGRPAADAPGVRFVGAEAGSAVYSLGSGEYRFVARG